MNSSVIYFDILIISTSDCDEKVRTLIDNWKLCTKKKIKSKKTNAISFVISGFLIHALVFGVELLDVHLLSLFSELITQII